jgi:hypothetical protein
MVVLEGLGGQMPILIKPFLFLLAFGQAAILFAVVIGLAGPLTTATATPARGQARGAGHQAFA